MIKLRDIYDFLKLELKDGEIIDYKFENNQIFEFVFGFKAIFINDNINILDENDEKILKYKKLVKERIEKTPLQYILGQWDFYNLTFLVGEGVLIPRQDTEIIIDVVISLNIEKDINVLDICSGSGCIGITIEKNIDIDNLILVEKSKEAFKYLDKNIKLNESRAKAFNVDLIGFEDELLDGFFDIVVSNPPYISKNDMENLSDEVKKEPEEALYGGEDGLFFYRYISVNYYKVLKKGGFLILEIGFDQKDDVINIVKDNGYKNIEVIKDLAGNNRVLKCQK
ncbi:MAG: peptide chain release factor N(5)-glutamine methyltransferase [Oscillospiraceae bacterium]